MNTNMNVNIFQKANHIIMMCDAAYLGVIDEDGYPSVSTVSPVNTENIFEAYFTTSLSGNKANRLIKCGRASVCFRTEYSNITLVGDAEILTDQETKSRCWQNWFIAHYPGGKTDPNYIVIKFTTRRVSLWIDNEGAEFTIPALLAVQSRCGLLCDGCAFRESMGCAGCVALNG